MSPYKVCRCYAAGIYAYYTVITDGPEILTLVTSARATARAMARATARAI